MRQSVAQDCVVIKQFCCLIIEYYQNYISELSQRIRIIKIIITGIIIQNINSAAIERNLGRRVHVFGYKLKDREMHLWTHYQMLSFICNKQCRWRPGRDMYHDSNGDQALQSCTNPWSSSNTIHTVIYLSNLSAPAN